jgi:peptidoglycan/LPS O-acetylase OafA/YrhL
MVVLFHAGVHGAKGGFFGVDVFFVISGFVITGLLLRERSRDGRTRIVAFYARRARRILPAAVLVVAVTLLATAVLVGGTYTTLVGDDSRWTLLFLGNFHFANAFPTFFTPRPPSPLLQFWSLAVEEQFYVVYPAFFIVIFALPLRLRPRTRLIIALLAVITASLILSVLTSSAGHLTAYYSPFTRAWELATGAAIAAGTVQLKRVPAFWAACASWAGLVLIVYSTVSIPVSVALPGTATILPVVGAALVIAGGVAARPRWGAESFLRLAPMRSLGRWSYSWYLWHWPVLVLAAQIAHKTVLGTSVAKNLLLSAFALVLAVGTYSVVEQPIRHSTRLARSPLLTAIGAGLLVASCFALTFAF